MYIAATFTLYSLLNQSDDQILSWSCDAVASRVIEAFLASPEVRIKSKKKFVYKHLHLIPDMAIDKYGSHIVEKCWYGADLPTKEKIAETLLEHKQRLQSSTHGNIVWNKLHMCDYERSHSDWLKKQESVQKKQQLFSDLFGVSR